MTAERADELVTISELARRRGVTKGAFARRVARLEAQGLVHLRPGPKGAKLISIVEFEKAISEATDAIREMNGRTKIASTPLDESLARAQARRTAADADLKELDRAERLAQIAPLDRVKQACAEFSQTLARVIDRRPSRVDEIIAANSRGGLQAARVVEKDERRELRAEMARAMDALADAAVGDGPAIDDLDHQDEALEGRAAPA